MRARGAEIVFVAALYVGLAGSAPLEAVSVPGAIPGRFSVGDSGGAIYEIPLESPPGIRGVGPRLRLAYDSQGGDGWLGLGWRLDGLPRISRCGAIYPIDGFRGGVEYDGEDRFCLDGQRLIQIRAASDEAPAAYRTEVESWRYVVANDICGSGPCSFTVTSRNGSVRQFGSASGRIVTGDGGNVRVWALDHVTDLNGNQMSITYTEDPLAQGKPTGDYYPLEIDYTQNPAAGFTDGRRAVHFTYESRPDTAMRYQGGVAIQTVARLREITMALDLPAEGPRPVETTVKSYRLEYGPKLGPANSSHLHSITVCDASGATGDCLGPTQVAWQTSALKFAGESTGLRAILVT